MLKIRTTCFLAHKDNCVKFEQFLVCMFKARFSCQDLGFVAKDVKCSVMVAYIAGNDSSHSTPRFGCI